MIGKPSTIHGIGNTSSRTLDLNECTKWLHCKPLLLAVFILFVTGCTSRTFYLSLQDHVKQEAPVVYDWEVSDIHPQSRNRIDSLVNARRELRSFLILKDDRLVYERYAAGFTARIPHNLKSASKSIVSLLAGIAIDQGKLHLSTDLNTLFGENVKMDSSAGKVTIEQLLTMRGGFPYTGRGYCWMVCTSLDPVKSSIAKRKTTQQDDSAMYSDISANLLGYAISHAVGMRLEEFARKELFVPLGIRSSVWERDARGNNASASDIFLCPRDLARIGFLMLHHGKVGDQQIISDRWIDLSTTPKTDVAGFPTDVRYGFLWWIDTNKTPEAYCAIGYGGQILYVSPLDNAVVVMTSSLKSNDWHSGLQMLREALKEVSPR